ncbi:MAG: nucleotidyltransferase domain-containing protein [Proteocatella sp.]
MFGLLPRDMEYILKALKKYPEIEAVYIFGSRAIGNYKKGSDVDMAVKGTKLDRRTVNRISDELNEEYPLPYFFDVIHYDIISNEQLKKHIDEFGKLIYRK